MKYIFPILLFLLTTACEPSKKDDTPSTGPKTLYGQSVKRAKDIGNTSGDYDDKVKKQADELVEDNDSTDDAADE